MVDFPVSPEFIGGGLVAKLYPTLVTHWTVSPRASSVHGIFQAGILEWVVIAFSMGSSQTRDRTWDSCIAGRFFTNRT